MQSVSHQEVLTCVHRRLHYRPVYLHKVKTRESLGSKYQRLGNLQACNIKQFSSLSSQHLWVSPEKLREKQKAQSLGNYLHGA